MLNMSSLRGGGVLKYVISCKLERTGFGGSASDSESMDGNLLQGQPPESPTPAATTTAGASFEPLDENLFSNLTLIQPQSQDDVSSSLDPPLSPSSSSSRRGVVPLARSLSSQISSTRKKKRAGIRIGYGRAAQAHDSSIDVDDTQHQIRLPSPSPSPLLSPSPSISSSPSLPIIVDEEKVQPGEVKQQIVPESGPSI
ncbi:hypothetical protein LXL04_000304 [Taraxacum kok-saghyz]